MKVAVMAVDGVLRKPVGGAPVPEGVRLYQALVRAGNVVLSHHDPIGIADWLELNGCVGHSFIEAGDTVEDCNDLRRQGYDIDLVVVPDPAVAAELIHSGFHTLLLTHSAFALPEWRPDSPRGVRAWDTITKQVADLARMRAEDARLSDGD